jgi:hypothetical protein
MVDRNESILINQELEKVPRQHGMHGAFYLVMPMEKGDVEPKGVWAWSEEWVAKRGPGAVVGPSWVEACLEGNALLGTTRLW